MPPSLAFVSPQVLSDSLNVAGGGSRSGEEGRHTLPPRDPLFVANDIGSLSCCVNYGQR